MQLRDLTGTGYWDPILRSENPLDTMANLPPSSSLAFQDLPQVMSLREILATFKPFNGQDRECQLLLAVLNAKSAEDQVIYFLILTKPQLIIFSCTVNCCSGQPPCLSARNSVREVPWHSVPPTIILHPSSIALPVL